MSLAPFDSDPERLERNIDATRRRLVRLRRLTESDGTEAPPAAFELQRALEELQVTREEQRLQSEAIRAQQRLLEVERARYRELFDFAPHPYLVTDPRGLIREANHATAELLTGQSDGAALRGKSVALFVSRSERQAFGRHLVEAAGREASSSWEATLETAAGVRLPAAVSLAPVRDPRGELIAFRWAVRDIRRRRLLEERERELARARAARKAAERDARRYRLLSDVTARLADSLDGDRCLRELADALVGTFCDACVVHRVEGESLREVARAQSTEGKPREPGRGVPREVQARFGLLPDDPKGIHRETIRRAEPRILSASFIASTNGADPRHTEVGHSGSPRRALLLPLRTGHTVAGLLTLLDLGDGPGFGREDFTLAREVAERAASALARCQRFEKVREALRRREDVEALVSHDLRNSLEVVAACAGRLKEQVPGDPEDVAAEHLAAIGRATDRMRQMIARLAAPPEPDPPRLDASPVPVRTLLEESCEPYRHLCRVQEIQLRIEVDDGLPPARVDRTRILPVLTRLVGHALQSTGAGGWITLRAEPAGRQLRLSVADNGSGIPELELERIFEAVPSQRRNGGPPTLAHGLDVCRKMVEAHGGRIWAESRLGVGTTFHFTLPTV